MPQEEAQTSPGGKATWRSPETTEVRDTQLSTYSSTSHYLTVSTWETSSQKKSAKALPNDDPEIKKMMVAVLSHYGLG